MEQLMAQAQDLQAKISAAQDLLSTQQVRGIGGNGDVIITMTGKYDVLSVLVQESALKVGTDGISKLFMDAYMDAKSKADALIQKVMNEVTGPAE